jgi:sugar phosphate isomerase/epimerase
MSEVTAERLAKIYTKIRAKRLELEKEVASLQEQQDLIGQEIINLCREQGVQTMRTEYGTVSLRTTKRYWTSDWQSMYEFIKEHDAFALLHQRINTTNMNQFLEENPDLHPPGLNADATQTVAIIKR